MRNDQSTFKDSLSIEKLFKLTKDEFRNILSQLIFMLLKKYSLKN